MIMPPIRADGMGISFVEVLPLRVEREADMGRIGVFERGVNYNVQVRGFGTGLVPPTEEQWLSLKKLRSLETDRADGDLPDELDNSATDFFPPVGSQANEGSCVAWSVGYYIHTYNEARERGWNLSTTLWTGGYYGLPATNRNMITSPDFVYHQINEGVDEGSWYGDAITIVTQVGGASWQEMPYDPDDHTSWPTEAAFREAARYRGRKVGNNYWKDTLSGYILVQSDADIDLIKQLVAEGYCLSISINAGDVYDQLDSNDVVSGTGFLYGITNHANTVVGYKEGAAWDPANPEG
jgi:hypothetical protein